MNDYCRCWRYINPRPSQLVTKDSLDKDTFLSVNISINDLPNLKSRINNFVNELERYLTSRDWLRNEAESIYIYPQKSIHFTLLAIARYPGHNNIADIQNVIGERFQNNIIEIVEKNKPPKFNISLEFVNFSSKSAFFVISISQKDLKKIEKFQKDTFELTSKALKDLGLDFKWCKGKNNPDCFPVNFLRWRTTKPEDIPSVLGRIEEEFIHNVTHRFNCSDVVRKFYLTYSNSFWWPEPEGRAIVQTLDL